MLRRKIVERQQRLPVLFQAFRRLRILGPIHLEEVNPLKLLWTTMHAQSMNGLEPAVAYNKSAEADGLAFRCATGQAAAHFRR